VANTTVKTREGKGASSPVKKPKVRLAKSVANKALPKKALQKKAPPKKSVSTANAANTFMLATEPAQFAPTWLISEGLVSEGLVVEDKVPLIKPKQVRKPRQKAQLTLSQAVSVPDPVTKHQPLTRAQAPVLWQKNGVFGQLRYWLRSTGRSIGMKVKAVGNSQKPRTQAAIGEKLRTKNDLLREIAMLRRENSVLRERLGLPTPSLGRNSSKFD
jgi:hypothetical protein